MTVHVLFADPPQQGGALPELVRNGPLDGAAARTLAEAMLMDTAAAVAASGGDLLVYHPAETAAGESAPEPAEALRELIADAVADPGAVRYEPQVGTTPADRIENACRHVLGEDDVASVAVLDGRTPTLDRTALDSAGMKLRRSEVVVGPAPAGQVAYLGMTEPLGFQGFDWPLGLESIVERAAGAGFDVDFLPLQPRVGEQQGLETMVALVRAKRRAGRRVPEHTAAAIDSLDL